MPDLLGYYREYQTMRQLEKASPSLENRMDTLNLIFSSKPRNKSETFFICEYDEGLKLQKINRIKEQKGAQVDLTAKTHDIVMKLLKSPNKLFVFSHNHTGADAKPSFSDSVFTFRYRRFLTGKNKYLYDHVVWSTQEIYSFRVNELI